MYPILEFDANPNAILNPLPAKTSEPASERVVLCFFYDILTRLAQENQLTVIGQIGSEMGPNPLYRLDTPKGPLLVLHPGVGAPLAAGFFEEAIALGGKYFVACGGCGVLHREIAAGHPVVLTGAVRDEGTSYHYLPPAREIGADPRGVAALEAACRAVGIDYRLGKTWTTDGFYRETEARRAARLAEGCEVVEMEAAALFAVARFRGVCFAQIVYGGDLVVPEGWDGRSWHHRAEDRQLMFDIAVKAVFTYC
jgi:uridine phosphorylase